MHLNGRPADSADARFVRTCTSLAVAFFVVGLVSRVAPLFDAGGRMLRQFPTEDGYLSLTIARNLALGRGMSVSEGLIPTNGTQPLVTLIWAGFFRLFGGSREAGVLSAQVFQVVISVLAAALIYRLGREVIGHTPRARSLALVGAAIWFAWPVALPHTMNCLETGLYALAAAAVALCFLRLNASEGAWSTRSALAFGALLGTTFLVRNDAVFLCAAFAVAHVAISRGVPLSRRVVEVALSGTATGIVAAPWLLYNVTHFGHPVPISGQSEAMGSHFGLNLRPLFVTLAEYLSGLPIPMSVEKHAVVPVGGLALALGATVILVRVLRGSASTSTKQLTLLGLTYGTLLCAYYGLFFGAAWFLPRYLLPLSPFIVVLWLGIASSQLHRLRGLALGTAAAGLAVVSLVFARLDYRFYENGRTHMHFQVVEWVNEHVPQASWVAAIQSGTLGFFHERTINLDGKVSPEALAARRAHRTPEYAVGKNVDFIVDWEGFAPWIALPALRSFELLVHDPVANLAVLRRKGAPTLAESRVEAHGAGTPSVGAPP